MLNQFVGHLKMSPHPNRNHQMHKMDDHHKKDYLYLYIHSKMHKDNHLYLQHWGNALFHLTHLSYNRLSSLIHYQNMRHQFDLWGEGVKRAQQWASNNET